MSNTGDGMESAGSGNETGVGGSVEAPAVRHKIVSINPDGRFENMKAFLAHIAEDEGACGFVGCILRKDTDGGSMHVPVTFNATREQVSFAAAILLGRAIEGD